MENNFVLLAVCVLFSAMGSFILFRSLTTGTIRRAGVQLNKTEHPKRFWASIAVYAVVTLLCLGALALQIFAWLRGDGLY